jgi:hypothetical protein
MAEADAGGVQTDPDRVAMDTMTRDARWRLLDQSTPKKDMNTFTNAVNEYLDAHGIGNASGGGMQKTKKATCGAHDSRYKNNAQKIANGSVVDEAHRQGLFTDKEWMRIDEQRP